MKKLHKILRMIPGYDPFATAGDCVLVDREAELAMTFFPDCLSHIEGKLCGEPFKLEDWQKAIVGNLFGWMRPDGTRRYREAMIYVPRKNGKTPLVAGIACYVLFCDDEMGQQNLCAAGDAEQAGLLYRYAAGMVEADSDLHKRCEIYGNSGGSVRKSIVVPSTGSFLRVVSADAKGKHGGNLHFAAVDELHVQETRDLVDTIETSMASANRRQPMFITITTADFDRPSICNEKHDYACKVRDGIIEDESLLPVIYEAMLTDDWTDPKVWATVNPNLCVSVSLDYMKRKCKKAQEQPSFENIFRRLHLNTKTEQSVRWLQLDDWDKCSGAVMEDQLKGRRCYGGLDMASTTDIASFELVFPDIGGKTVVKSYFWIPSDNAHARERRDKVPYVTWAKQGFIKMTDGNIIDQDVIRADIGDIGCDYEIVQIFKDPWNSAQIGTQLMADGFDVVDFRQGFKSMAAPTKELERLVLSGELDHLNNPVLRWMASNVSLKLDPAGNMKPDKSKSTEKIDGIVATIMGVGGASVDIGPKESIYETQDLIVV